jgi:hypothetical protein
MRARSVRPLSSVVPAAAVGLFLIACSGDSKDASITPATACSDVATALCDKIEACAPFFASVVYADRDTCVARSKINCESSFTAPGTSATTTRASECARDVKTAECEDLLARRPPETCRTLSGALEDGKVCGHDAQCKNKLCRVADGETCGACSSLGGPGSACERDEECNYELKCAGNKCTPFGTAGIACSDTLPCKPSLTCTHGVCATPLAAGASCTFSVGDNPCDATGGYYCHPKNHVCTAFGQAPAGGTCELTVDKVTVCVGGADCTRGSNATGRCEAPAADGAACSDAAGPKCLAPAHCAAGVCTIIDPATCK